MKPLQLLRQAHFTAQAHLPDIQIPELVPTPRIAGELIERGIQRTVDQFFGEDFVAAESHLHLGGGLPKEIAARMAHERSPSLQAQFSDPAEIISMLERPHLDRSLLYYLKQIYHPIGDPIFADTTALEDVAFFSALHAFYTGARKLVLRTSIKHGSIGDSTRNYAGKSEMTATEEFAAYIRGFERAEALVSHQLYTSLIVCMRRQDPDQALSVLDKVFKLKDTFGEDRIVGIDIMGLELGYGANPFKACYDLAGEHNLHRTAHLGEDKNVGVGALQDGIVNLRCNSIGHGTSLVVDPRVVFERYSDGKKVHSFIQALQSPNLRYFEMCLSSNINTGGAFMSHTDPTVKDHRGAPKQHLAIMDANGYWYPDDALMAFGHIRPQGVPPLSVHWATDGIFPNNTTLAREASLSASNRNLGIEAVLGRNLHSILSTPGPWKRFTEQWLASARLYIDIPDIMVPNKANYYRLAETLMTQSRNEAQERLHQRLGTRMPLEEMREFVRREVDDVENYVSSN